MLTLYLNSDVHVFFDGLYSADEYTRLSYKAYYRIVLITG